jgi:DNA invertase Pin-like site-specific DNA recombinase
MKAALYLRSSKDRNDVSLAAQRHELEKLATSRSLEIVTSYEDAVESGKTDDRPGFSELVRAIKDPKREWTYLLVYDTSRIARRRYIAQAIKHEAKKRGVTILYARLPSDLDPVSELFLESIFEAMDEAHSIMSREKGLAGMAENVRQGWRAGGRAPMGYSLESHATGAIRDGKPVTKTKLVPNEQARAVKRYLKARASGVPRSRALRDSGIKRTESTMIGVEWNALTYAGHTVWNRHLPHGSGTKRRPRSEWHINEGTHQALISDAEAEAILAQLETSKIGEAVRRGKAAMSKHLLTGLLYTPEGEMWVGHGKYYRLRRKERRGKLVRAELVDTAVLDRLQADMRSDRFLRSLLEAARKSRQADPAAPLEDRIRQLEREKTRAAELALTSDAATFLGLVSEKSRQVEALKREVSAVRADKSLSQELARLTVDRLRELVTDQGPRRMLETFVERVVLSADLECQIELKAVPGSRWRSVASPRGCAGSPPELIQRPVILPAA